MNPWAERGERRGEGFGRRGENGGEEAMNLLGTWAGVVAEKSGDVRECALASPRRARGGRI
jgi:hypothetical protein